MQGFIVFLSMFFGVLLPQTLFHAYQFFILEECDRKFSCMGNFQLILLIYFIVGFLVAIGSLISFSALKETFEIESSKFLFLSLFILGSLFSLGAVPIINTGFPLVIIGFTIFALAFVSTAFLMWLFKKYNKPLKQDS